MDWATTQHNLGAVLGSIGLRKQGTEELLQSKAACEEALKERTREREMKTLTADDEAEFDRRINGWLLMIAQREHL